MKKQLKIAIFYNLPESGALKALQDNLNILKKNGHYVDIYTTDTSDDSFAPLSEYSDNIYTYHVKRRKFRNYILNILEKISPSSKFGNIVRIKYKDFVDTQKNIAKDIDSRGYDLVLSEQDHIFSKTPAILKYLKTLKVYYCQQPDRSNERILLNLSGGQNKNFRQKINNRIYKKYFNLDIEYAQFTDYMLCNSFFSHENLLRRYGINASVSYLGINTEQFRPLNIPRKNIVLSVGGISYYKGFDFIIRSISKVDKDIRPKFIIVGYRSNDNWAEYLKSLANELNVDLEIISGISYEELVKLYNEVKMVIFAPYLEAFGLIPLEASACGTPVIGVKEGGVKETVIHMKNGLSLERNEFIFAEGITELLTNTKLWNELSIQGPQFVNDFWTLEQSGKRLLNHIYRILDEENKK
ncbi:glycosyltransferase family 4 protein [Methanobrevibacter sp.]